MSSNTDITWKDINTFEDVFNIFINIELNDFTKLLCLKTNGKDILETSLRFLAYANCLDVQKSKPEGSEFIVCTGNYNIGNLQKANFIGDLLCGNNYVKDSGDSSDLTMINSDGDTLLAITSKNLKNKNMSYDKLDFDKLVKYGRKYEDNFNITYGICCNDKQVYYNMIDKCKDTTLNNDDRKYMKELLVIDRSDLEKSFQTFKLRFQTYSYAGFLRYKVNKDYTSEEKITFRPHQEYTINKSYNIIKKGKKVNLLWLYKLI
jgi:hypothetical protein